MFRVIILLTFASIIYSADVSAQGFNYQIDNRNTVKKTVQPRITEGQREAAKPMEYREKYMENLPADEREATEASAKKMLRDPEMKKIMMESLNDFEGEEREKLRIIYEKITGSVKKTQAEVRDSKK